VVSTSLEKNSSEISESQIAAILEHRYGEGMVCLPRKRLGELIELAKQLGFIDAEDYLTRKGRTLLARYH
jgi:hypothetical protein